jgi:hypothetical protein
MLLDHGADTTRRDSEGGPVGRAAYAAPRSIISKTARHRLGHPVLYVLEQDLASRRGSHLEIPEEMLKIQVRYLREH